MRPQGRARQRLHHPQRTTLVLTPACRRDHCRRRRGQRRRRERARCDDRLSSRCQGEQQPARRPRGQGSGQGFRLIVGTSGGHGSGAGFSGPKPASGSGQSGSGLPGSGQSGSGLPGSGQSVPRCRRRPGFRLAPIPARRSFPSPPRRQAHLAHPARARPFRFRLRRCVRPSRAMAQRPASERGCPRRLPALPGASRPRSARPGAKGAQARRPRPTPVAARPAGPAKQTGAPSSAWSGSSRGR